MTHLCAQSWSTHFACYYWSPMWDPEHILIIPVLATGNNQNKRSETRQETPVNCVNRTGVTDTKLLDRGTLSSRPTWEVPTALTGEVRSPRAKCHYTDNSAVRSPRAKCHFTDNSAVRSPRAKCHFTDNFAVRSPRAKCHFIDNSAVRSPRAKCHYTDISVVPSGRAQCHLTFYLLVSRRKKICYFSLQL
jgi:hypothetical protein